MKPFRFRTIDALVAVSLFAVVCGAYAQGYRPSLPRYLTGGLSAYRLSEVRPPRIAEWQAPPADDGAPADPQGQFSIRQLPGVPPAGRRTVRRVDWVRVGYDAVVTLCVGALVLVPLASRFRRPRSD